MTPSRTEVNIGDNRYFIRKLPPFEALALLGTLQKSFLGPLVDVIKGASADASSAASYAPALRSLSENLDGPQMVKLAKLVLNAEYISIQPPEADAPVKLTEGQINLFIEGVGEMLELCMEVITVNFADFGKRATALFGEARSAMAEQQTK